MEEHIRKKKNTRVIAIADNSAYGISAIRAAASLSVFFQSGLTIVTHFSLSKKIIENQKEIDYSSFVQTATVDLDFQLNEDQLNTETLHSFAEATEGIMYVIGVAAKGKDTIFNRKKALKFIKTSRLPVMTVGAEIPSSLSWEKVFISVDIHRQEKEKALWAGYFYRFGQSELHLLHPIYKDEFLKQKTEDNIKFIQKLYGNLEITATLEPLDAKIDNIDAHILQNSEKYLPSVLVIMMTKYYSLIDMLFGTREKRLIANAQNIPVLCINERDDLYVLCT